MTVTFEVKFDIKITKEELAEKLNGIEYRGREIDEVSSLASKNNLLIVFGASDDLLETRGVDDDEYGCYDGGFFILDKTGVLVDIEERDLDKTKPYIEAIWDNKELGTSWNYKTNVPHATFKIMETDDDEQSLYCIGLVIDLNNLEVVNDEV